MSEQEFINAIAQNPSDDALRLVYADWLEERGDPRAEFLRLTSQVRAEAIYPPELATEVETVSKELALCRDRWRGEIQVVAEDLDTLPTRHDPANQARIQELERALNLLLESVSVKMTPARQRLQELGATLDPKWTVFVSDPIVEGCGLSKGTDRFRWRLSLDFVCTKKWSDMKPTDDPKVRLCEGCKEHVYFCDTMAEARMHAHDNHCIGLDVGIPRRANDIQGDSAMFGNPSRESYAELWERDVDEVSKQRMAKRTRAEVEATKGREQVVWQESFVLEPADKPPMQRHLSFVSADNAYHLRPRFRKGKFTGEYDVWSNKPPGPRLRPWLPEEPTPPDGYRMWKSTHKADRNYFGVAEKDRREDGTWLGWV